jgi:hypothetical protein
MTFAVKIGEIHLTSERPISQEDREAFIQYLQRNPVPGWTVKVVNGALFVKADIGGIDYIKK